MRKIRLTSGMRFIDENQFESGEDHGGHADRLGEIIASLPVFSMLDKDQIKELMPLVHLNKYEQGRYLIKENQAPRMLYFLISGHVTIIKNNVKLGELRRTGDIFGEMSFIDEKVRSASVQAKKETLCLEIDMRGVDLAGMDRHAPFFAVIYRAFSEILALRLRKMNDELIYLRSELTRARAENKR